MHLLELTKSAWNAQFSADINEVEETIIKERVGSFLNMSREVLRTYGPEGDEGGPVSEIEVLEDLLSET
jgi:SET and MYND domain-containing protein